MKYCAKCKQHKPHAAFAIKRCTPDGLQPRCRDCNRWIQKLLRYGVSEQQFRELLVRQGGVCAICKHPEQRYTELSVDHDHKCCSDRARSCGKCIRGLLCSSCNPMIGYAYNNPQLLREAAVYLEKERITVASKK